MRLDPGEDWPHIDLTVCDGVGDRARKHTCHRVLSPLFYSLYRIHDHECTPCGTMATRPDARIGIPKGILCWRSGVRPSGAPVHHPPATTPCPRLVVRA